MPLIKPSYLKLVFVALGVLTLGLFLRSYALNGFSLAQTALVVPLVVVVLSLMDVSSSREQPNLFHDPLVGQSATSTESFRAIDGSFEGRVLLNGATWNAICSDRQLSKDDQVLVTGREGQVLQVTWSCSETL